MFDKLVESTSTGAELGPRRRIFAATLVLVTTLFAAGIVASIYAADFDLGNDSFDIAELLTPVTETEPKAEPEQPQQRQNNQASTSDRQSRTVNQLRIDEQPSEIPPISTQRNAYLSRPDSPFIIDSRRGDSNGPPIEPSNGLPQGNGNASSKPPLEDTDPVPSQPPPPVKAPEPKPPTSLGVITGKASHLPRPTYPAAAKAVGASGAVNVQVTIDEQGNVISAKAVGGHILLRAVSEEAARRAKFSPTTLSKVPVKVTGVIVYNFTK